jgi:hypothetical protein
MATPGALVKAMAEVLGLPEATVTQYDRQLSEDGLRSKSGRGSSAAKVTARDAASLLIAIVASPSIKAASQTCITYGDLVELSNSASKASFARLNLMDFAILPPRHLLIDALTTLINSAAHGDVINTSDWTFTVKFSRPILRVEISSGDALGLGCVYTPRQDASLSTLSGGDLSYISVITFATIRRLAAILAEEGSG